MMIAFITFNSSLVLLIEGLCSSNPWEFEFSGLKGIEPTKCGRAPFPSKQIWRSNFFRQPVCPISIKTDLETHFVPTSGEPNFHQNRLGDSIFPDIRCVPFPSKQVWKFTFFAMRTCPISAGTDFEIHFFLKSGRVPCQPQQFPKFTFS